MKGMTTCLIFAAALFCASGAAADDTMAPNGAPDQSQPGTMAPGKSDASSKKAAWESKVKSDCAAEIGPGGVCERMDFDSGLEKCLHKNRQKLSDSCKSATHPHKHGKMEKKGAMEEDKGAKPAESQGAPTEAPAQAPTNP